MEEKCEIDGEFYEIVEGEEPEGWLSGIKKKLQGLKIKAGNCIGTIWKQLVILFVTFSVAWSIPLAVFMVLGRTVGFVDPFFAAVASLVYADPREMYLQHRMTALEGWILSNILFLQRRMLIAIAGPIFAVAIIYKSKALADRQLRRLQFRDYWNQAWQTLQGLQINTWIFMLAQQLVNSFAYLSLAPLVRLILDRDQSRLGIAMLIVSGLGLTTGLCTMGCWLDVSWVDLCSIKSMTNTIVIGVHFFLPHYLALGRQSYSEIILLIHIFLLVLQFDSKIQLVEGEEWNAVVTGHSLFIFFVAIMFREAIWVDLTTFAAFAQAEHRT
ncbi:unnamed protein product [Effrenium voratum]|nr:unnamed protein product [Effrenium voratum]